MTCFLLSGGVMLIHDMRNNESRIIDFRETAPSGIHEDMMLNLNQRVKLYFDLLSSRLNVRHMMILKIRSKLISASVFTNTVSALCLFYSHWCVSFRLLVRSVSGCSRHAQRTTSSSSAVSKVQLCTLTQSFDYCHKVWSALQLILTRNRPLRQKEACTCKATNHRLLSHKQCVLTRWILSRFQWEILFLSALIKITANQEHWVSWRT